MDDVGKTGAAHGKGNIAYSATIGLVFTFNLIVGTGALAIPKAFQDAGLLLGVAILSLLCLVSYISTTYVVECMSATNALLAIRRKRLRSSVSADALDEEDENGDNDDLKRVIHLVEPQAFEIKKQVELGHMASLLLNKGGIAFFYACLCLYLFGDLAIYATVVPKSLTSVVCSYLPADSVNASCLGNFTYDHSWPCWQGSVVSRISAYRIFVIVFGASLGPFIFTNVGKTKFLQILTSFTRWLAFAIMVILTTIRLIEGKGQGHPVAANFSSFTPFFGVCVYAFMCQHSLPALITPIKNKSRIYSALAGVFALVFGVYSVVAVTAVFAFSQVHDIYTLNFRSACQMQTVGATSITDNLAVLEYFLTLFPVFTLSTSFPIIGITLRNNLLRAVSAFSNTTSKVSPFASAAMLRSSESQPLLIDSVQSADEDIERDDDVLIGHSNTFKNRVLRLFKAFVNRAAVPLLVILLPLCIALATDDVEFLVSFTGSYAGVGVQYVMPALLMLGVRRSIGRELDRDVPKRYASPFRHVIWVWLLLIWAVLTVIIVSVNHAYTRFH